MASVHGGEEILPKALAAELGARKLQTDMQRDRRICGRKDPTNR